MRIGLNLLYLLPGQSGGRETYARELIGAIRARAPDLELVAFAGRDAAARIAEEHDGGLRVIALPVSARSRVQWALGELALVAAAARRERVELLHSLANFGPPWGPFKHVLTIHDMQYRALPALISPPARIATSTLVSLAARRADRIITVSAASREEIVAGLHIPPDRIEVIPNGVSPPVPAADGADRLRERHRLGSRPVALTVASNLPHKNLPVLFDALARIPAERRPVLVIAGHGTDEPGLRALASAAELEPDVRLLGGRSSAELESLYALASCLVLPTLYEGFGLPALEAMARSVPVVCSDIRSLREVAGDAARYFEPHAPAEIAAKMTEVIYDSSVSERMQRLGADRACTYSWPAAAEQTLNSYMRALAMS